jgi:DNA-directed RNA polymerase specialized sigma24 family protein
MTADEAVQSLHEDPHDTASWGELYGQLAPPLTAYVSATLVTFNVRSQDPSDIVHDTFIAVMQRWVEARRDIPNVQALMAYLKRAARNKLIDRYRHEKTATRLLAFLSLTFEVAFRGDPGGYRRLFIEQVISNLPRQCGEILKLYVEEDLSPAELADKLQLSPSAFYSRWYRCLQRAKDFVQKNSSFAR